jgi:ketosteroid isomerase-like protein
MTSDPDVAVVVDVLRAVERRDLDRLVALYHPEIEFFWPPGLPYSGTFRGANVMQMSARYEATWGPLQPDAQARSLGFRIVAKGDDGTVVVEYSIKGVDSKGHGFSTPTMAEYQVREGRFASARMFYYDLPGMIAFLTQARRP